MKSYQSMIVGFDFTPCSTAALGQALRLAAGFKAELRAVHVIDTLVAIELEEALSELQQNVRDGLLADARRAWEESSATIPGSAAVPFDVTINSRLVGIVAKAREYQADLLVLGAFGETAADVGVGTVATACVRSAPSDVLLVRDTQRDPFKLVVAAVDFSEHSARALERAAQLAQKDGAALHVLHVFEAPWHRLHYRAPTTQQAPHFVRQYRDGIERRLEEFARATLQSITAPEPQCHVLDQGGHRSGIVAYAQEQGADLIALGTRGRANLHDVLLGTTAEKTLQLSTCSVLAVRPATA